MAGDLADGKHTEVELSFFPDGTGRFDSNGEYEFSWQFLENIHGLMILPRDLKYCQPGPKIGLRPLSDGTVRIQIQLESLLPAGMQEFFKYRDEPVATLAQGKVVRLTRSKWLLSAGGSLIFAGVMMYVSLPGGTILDPIKAFLSLLIAIGGFVTCLRWVMPRNRRLVIGRDRLQLVDGDKTIVGQFPYDQIESIHFSHGEDEESYFYWPAVTIRLVSLMRPDTFWPDVPFEKLDFVIQDRFEFPPDDVRKMLRSRWQAYQHARAFVESPAGDIPRDADMVG